jgi:UDP-glucose 4-epimerase
MGAHACRAIKAAGYQPVVYDNLSTGHRSFVQGPLVTGNLIDKAKLARVFAREFLAVMHFAAAASSALHDRSAADAAQRARC